MSSGDLWRLMDGRMAIELRRSGQQLVVAEIVPDWPWIGRPEIASQRFCELQPSRYLNGALPESGE